MKKAQINQAFTFIMIIIVIGLIVIFGYRGINSIIEMNCQKQRMSFENNLIGFIERYTDKGSVHSEVLKAPCKVKSVCFLNATYCPRAGSSISPLPFFDPAIKSEAEDCTANIFIVEEFTGSFEYSEQTFFKEVALRGPPFQCFNESSGEFRFLFTGLGRKTLIEEDI